MNSTRRRRITSRAGRGSYDGGNAQQQQEMMRRSMNERSHERAHRIRKKRKEEMLFQRRNRNTTATKQMQQQQQPPQERGVCVSSDDFLPLLTSCIESFVVAMTNVDNHYRQGEEAAIAAASVIQTLQQSLSSLTAAASSNNDKIVSGGESEDLDLVPIYQCVIRENEAMSRRFVSKLCSSVKLLLSRNNGSSSTTAAATTADATSVALTLLADLCHVPTSSTSGSHTAMRFDSSSNDAGADDSRYSYYGNNDSNNLMIPGQWKDLIVQEAGGNGNKGLIANASALLTSRTTTTTRDLAAQLLGCLVSDEVPSSSSSSSSCIDSSREALRMALPHWPQIASALPTSAYACASILRSDETTLGMNFLSHLTTSHLTSLLNEAETTTDSAVYAAWMIESLTKREDAAVDAVCGDSALVQALIGRIHSSTMAHSRRVQAAGDVMGADAASSARWSFFLVPALRSIGNIVTACDGRYVEFFLRQEELRLSLCALLAPENNYNSGGYMPDALWLAGCLLCDAGISGHASTEIGAPVLLPAIVSVLVSDNLNIIASNTATFEWKRLAVAAMYNAVSEPPAIASSVHSPTTTTTSTTANRIEIGERVLWGSVYREQVVKELVHLLTVPDSDAVWYAIEILDFLLRSIPASRNLFESIDGVDKLDELCTAANIPAVSSEETGNDIDSAEAISEIAANLLDDFFGEEEYGEDGNDVVGSQNNLVPSVQDGQFAFGVVGTNFNTVQQQQTVAPAFGGQEPPPGAGRGRGRTLPAWMMKQQQQT